MKYLEDQAVRNAAPNFRDERGFSLVELVLTLVLIGIIAAVAVAKYVNLSDKARTAVCRTNQYSLESAQNIFFADQLTKNRDAPHYADKLDDLAPCMAGNLIPACPLGFAYEIQSGARIRCLNRDHERRL